MFTGSAILDVLIIGLLTLVFSLFFGAIGQGKFKTYIIWAGSISAIGIIMEVGIDFIMKAVDVIQKVNNVIPK